MLTVGLTGGIGAGKSTFAALLAERGAQIVDADLIGRDALRPGRPAWHSVVDTFGDEILAGPRLEIDRARLAAIVFADPRKLAALNAIVHPVIVNRIADDLDRLRNTDDIVVVDAALIAELNLQDTFDVVVAVVSEPELRQKRLRNERGMSVSDIRARMAAQKNPEEVSTAASIVVRNDGSLEELAREAERVWDELVRLRDS